MELTIEDYEFLSHHGIEGMHWGIRRARETQRLVEKHNARFLAEKAKLRGDGGKISGKEVRRLADKHNANFIAERAKLHGKNLTKSQAQQRVRTGKKVAWAVLGVWGAATVASIAVNAAG